VWTLVTLLALANATLAPTCLTYKGDVERACDAEHLSSMKATDPALMDWLQGSVGTPEGLVLAKELSTKGARDRSLQLRTEARVAGIAACPLADTYEAQAKNDDVKQEVQNLCDAHALLPGGGAAVLDIGAAPTDDERLREISEWSQSLLKTQDVQAIVARLAQTPPRGRGPGLRAEGARSGAASCALADALDRPLPVAAAREASQVLPTFVITSFDSEKTARKYGGAAVEAVRNAGSAVNTCYAVGLAKDPKLAGKVLVHVSLDGSGKVTSAKDDGSTLADKKVVKCIADAASAMAFAKPDKTGVKFTIGLTLAPATSPAAPAVSVALVASKTH